MSEQSGQFHRLEEVFHNALAREAGPSRDQFLAEVCDGDEDLLAKAVRLLRLEEETPALDHLSAGDSTSNMPRFGAFQTEAVIGRGGAGVVYRARRIGGLFDQVVAVKVFQQGLQSQAFEECFHRERQILAGLRHPGVAHMLDCGIEDRGDQYIVMEYVDGKWLDEFCRIQSLGIRERLKLFIAVCDVVSYAHRNLVAHLDLKPSNILVTSEAKPKLLDFGTARLLAAVDANVTQHLATPRYASPEQLRGERVGIASDIYSLGIVLAELLTGAWPFGDPDSQLLQLRRATEGGLPKPLGEAASESHASCCGLSLKQLQGMLTGDLDAIVTRSLESSPDCRYHSIEEFAADIERYLDGRPVLARPQSWTYRTQRFLGRHRIGLAAVAAIALIVSVLAVYALWQQRLSIEEGRRAHRLNRFLMRLFVSANPAYGGRADMTVAELGQRALSQADLMLAHQPLSRAELAMIVSSHQALASGIKAALPTLNAAVEVARQAGDPEILAGAIADRGYFLMFMRDCQNSIADLDQARNIVLAHLDRIRLGSRASLFLLYSAVRSGCAADRKGALAAAEEGLRLSRMLPEESLDESASPKIIKAFAFSTVAQVRTCEEGKQIRNEGLEFAARNHLHAVEAEILWRAGACHHREGFTKEGDAILLRALHGYESAFGASHPLTAMIRANRAYLLADTGKPELRSDAAREAQIALNNSDCNLMPLACATVQSYASQALTAVGQFSVAHEAIRRLLPDPVFSAPAQTCLFVHFVESGRLTEAAQYRQSAATWARTLLPADGFWRRRIESALAKKKQ